MPNMKLLFDQNISFRILRLLPDSFSDCRQVSSVGLHNRDDVEIWQYAQRNGFTIVTFDADFFDLSILRGFPPKIVWLRTGNLTTSEIAELIILNYLNIISFINNSDQSCLDIF
jgi:predicted nuclease of predicted toxin-antitoxin system